MYQLKRKAGLRTGLYYSPMDWRFPGYFKPKELAENAALMKRQTYEQIARAYHAIRNDRYSLV